MSTQQDTRLLEEPGLTGFISRLLYHSAPRPRPRLRLRDVVEIGQRWRCRWDGEVVLVTQIHRADQLVETIHRSGDQSSRQTIPFADLAVEYDLLVSLERAR